MSARSKVLLSVLGSLLALAMAALAGEAPGNRASILHQTSDGTQTVLQTGEVILTALPHVGDEILVRFKDGVSQGALASAHARLGAKLVKRYSLVRNLKRIKLPRGVSVEEAIESYLRDLNVLYAEPNYIVKLDAAPNDPRFGELWGLHNIGQSNGTADADIDAPEAWDLATGSNNVVVAVIDTGVDYNHQDLSANMWSNTLDCNTNGIDDDGNGYIDDCYGIDAVNNDSNPMDDHNHGTHVAGTIGAVGNNSIGVVGVNWNVSIMACKFLDASGSGTVSDAIECLDYVKLMKDRGVNIVATNNSWGGGLFSQALFDAIDAHRQRGILFIAAAGNSGANNDFVLQYPASYYLPNIISVAATTRYDRLADFTNYGRRTVHLGAPGAEILSTTIGNTYSTFSGTSMAAPHVTGVAALLKAQNPALDWRAIKNLILAGGDTVNVVNSRLDNTISQKRLNAYRALTCSNSTILSRLLPNRDTIEWSVGRTFDLSALHINCANPNGNVTVVVNPGNLTVTLRDDGFGSDEAAGDGIYSGQWTPSSSGTYTLTFPGGNTVSVSIDPDLKPGFPVQALHTAGSYYGGPIIHTLVGNIDSDPKLEIIGTGLADGPLYAWRSDGSLVLGWPVEDIFGPGYPALGTLSSTLPGFQIFSLIGSPDFAPWAVAYTGSGSILPGWPVDRRDHVAAPSSMADIEGDGLDEAFLAGIGPQLYAFRPDGTSVSGWPINEPHSSRDYLAPAVADLDNDGDLEFVFALRDSTPFFPATHIIAYHHDGIAVTGFPVSFVSNTSNYLVVGDVDGDGLLEIIVATHISGSVYSEVFVISSGGMVKGRIPVVGRLLFGTAPALADLDGDSIPEIIVQTEDALNVVRGDGSTFPGWPVTWSDRLLGNSAPVVGDVDGDGLPDIVITTQFLGSNVGEVRVYNRNGILHPRFPKVLPIGAGVVPAIADIDLDGRNDIIITGSYWNGIPGYYDKVWVFDLGGPAHGPILWGQFMGGPKHQGVYSPPLDPTRPVAGVVTPSDTQFGDFVDSPFDLTTSFTDNESAVTSCEYTTDGTTWSPATVSGSAPNFTCIKTGITGTNGQALTLNMRAVSSGGTGTATAVTRTVDAAAPITTDNAPAGWVGANQTVTLTPSDGSGSEVTSTQYCTDTANSCTPATNGTSVLVTCGAGTVCQTYVRYGSTDNVGNAETTKSLSVRIDKAVPAAVANLGAPSATNTSVTLTWSNPADSGSGNASFDVRYRIGNTFTEADWAVASQASGEPVPPSTGMTVGGLTCGTTYAFALKTKDNVGNESTISNTPTQTTLACDSTAPGSPIGLVASSSGWTNVNSFALNWTNPSDPSGIVAAWYKVGSAPTLSTNGTRVAGSNIQTIPGVQATAQGGESVYVWLEDGTGNKDHNNRSSTTLNYDATAPTSGSIAINNGAASTSSLIVTLNSLGAVETMSGLSQMRFSNNASTWSPWESYGSTRNNWDLSQYGGNASGGTKTVYVQYKDAAGNESISFSDTIEYLPPDPAAPTGSITINSNATYTNSTAATLNLSATDAVAVTGYYLSTNSTPPLANAAGWVAVGPTTNFSANVPYTLSAGDATKTVHAWYKDAAGNVSTTASDSIILDQTAPTTTDNAPAGWVGTDQTVTLTPSDGSGSGIAGTQYCRDTANSCTPSTNGPSVLVTCGVGAICQTYVRYRSTDNVGNVETIKSALVRIDKAVPAAVGDLTAPTATASSVALSWSNPADGGSGNASFDVRYRVGTTFTEVDWGGASQPAGEPSPPTTGMLVGNLTCRTTYAFALKTTDGVGNVSVLSNVATRTTSACPDTTPPVAGVVTPSNTQFGSFVDSPFDLTTSFTDNESAVTSCEYTTDGGTTWNAATVSGSLPNFTCTKTGITGSNGQVLTLNMRATSGGGTSQGTAVQVRVDSAAPTGSVKINSNAAFTNSTSVKLSLSASDSSGVAEMCISNTNSCSAWETFAKTKNWNLPPGDGAKTVYVWFKDRVGNANSSPFSDQITLDTVAPTNPTSVNSTSHTLNVWSKDRTVDMAWSGATDDRSNVYGYSIKWDRLPTTLPDSSSDTTSTKKTSSSLSDGNNHYFHIRTRDKAGNWTSSAVHLGPFFIDGTGPVNGTLNATAGSGQVSLSWSGFSDPMSGLATTNTYKLVFSTSGTPSSKCTSGTQIFLGTGTSFVHNGLINGTPYYYRVCAFDKVGNVSTGATRSAIPQ